MVPQPTRSAGTGSGDSTRVPLGVSLLQRVVGRGPPPQPQQTMVRNAGQRTCYADRMSAVESMTTAQRTGAGSERDCFTRARTAQADAEATRDGSWRGVTAYYHQCLEHLYARLTPPGSRVLELGCGRGNVLAATRPAVGVGVDLSTEMLRIARSRYPDLRFIHADVLDLDVGESFDVIILSDLVNDVWDVQSAFEVARRHALPHSRLLLNFYSHVWQLPLQAAGRVGLASPKLGKNWITREDADHLLGLAGFETVRHFTELLWPVRTPLLDTVCNRYLARLWPFSMLALSHVMIARPRPNRPVAGAHASDLRVSVIVPARNEAGNISAIMEAVPEMGAGTELIFVEGGSTDDTYEVIRRTIEEHPQRTAMLLRQPGRGKADAVRAGFARATGDVFMIYDADMTVPSDDLVRFYRALRDNVGEFINGSRLVYPMESGAMQYFNLVANRLFGLTFSWLLGQSIKDTLCGTKVLSREHYEQIAANRSHFGDFDPFGDFDLLFGAANLNLKIVDLPIRYRERTYGSTNIDRWRHGLLLLRMVAFAARRIKFVSV